MIISVFVLERGSTFFRNAILLATPIIECIQASRFSGSVKYSGWGFCEEPVSKNRAALKQPWQSLWIVLWELMLKPDILFRVWLRKAPVQRRIYNPQSKIAVWRMKGRKCYTVDCAYCTE